MEIIETIDLHNHLIKNPISSYFLRVAGLSMIEAGINPGDIVAVDKSLDPRNGSLVVAAINGEFLLKRFIKSGNTWTLQTENRAYKKITLDECDTLEIFGTVVGVIRKIQ